MSTPGSTRNGYGTGRLTVHSDPAKLAAVTRALRGAGRKVVLVPTMGALHEGHRELIRHAKRIPGAVVPVVSIFVNPLQFGADEDLDRYPRPIEADLDACRDEGVELVFTPQVEHMYPPGSQTRVTAGPLGDELEGASRTGHFDGVLTVVSKLFHIVGPDVALFGEKDYQQLTLIRRMVRDLDFPAGSSASRPSGRTTDWPCPRATSTSTPVSVAPPPCCRARWPLVPRCRSAGTTRCWRPPAPSWRPSRRSTSTTWSCATPTSARSRSGRRGRPTARRRPGRHHPAHRQRPHRVLTAASRGEPP